MILVEDDPAVRDALQVLLAGADYEVEAFESGEDFLDSFDPADSFCVLLDMNLPGMSGLEVQKALIKKGSHLPVIFLTGHGEISLAVQAMRAGAIDFIEKPSNNRELLEVVERARQTYAKGRAKQVTEDEANQHIASLTDREREVFERVSIGRQNKEIARELEISPRTVEIYRARVMRKLGVENLSQLIRVSIVSRVYPDGK